MNWNAYILDLTDKGHTPEDIIAEANNPLITLKYVQDTLLSEKYKKRPRGKQVFRGSKDPGMIRLYEYCMKVGKEQFLREVKATTYAEFAKRFDAKRYQVDHLIIQFIKEPKKSRLLVGKFGNYERQLIAQGKMKKKPKQTTIQDVLNLW